MIHLGYIWCKCKFPFVNWTIFQYNIESIRYLLTKTWQLLHWWTLALENLNHNSQLNWFAGTGFYMLSVFKMGSVFPVPLSFTLGSPLSLNNRVWHHSGWTPVFYLEQSPSFSQSINRVMDLWALIWRSLLMQICLLKGRSQTCGSCVLHATPSYSLETSSKDRVLRFGGKSSSRFFCLSTSRKAFSSIYFYFLNLFLPTTRIHWPCPFTSITMHW